MYGIKEQEFAHKLMNHRELEQQIAICRQESAALEELPKWVDVQVAVNWVIVTLRVEGKSRNVLEHRQKALRYMLSRLSQLTLGSNGVKRKGDKLLCVPCFGGDDSGAYFHYQLLLEKRSRKPMSMAEFRNLIWREWNRSLGLIHRWDGRVKEPLEGKVWLQPCRGGWAGYLRYLQRCEGTTFGFGLKKVDVNNLYLKGVSDATLSV